LYQPPNPSYSEAQELSARIRIVDEACSWTGTSWHHAARVKGHGVDCAQYLIAVYYAAGIIPMIEPEDYPADWHLHRDEPRFLRVLMEHCKAVISPKAGDIAMFDYGRHAAHGGIMVDGSRLIHADRAEGRVTITDLPGSPLLARLHGFYRWKGFA
jgi:cell wall-associated NlpC family hydrolase